MAEEEGASGEEEERPGVMEVPGLEPRPSAERRGPRLSGLRLPHPNREDGRMKLTGAVRVKHNTQAEAGQGTSDCSPFSSRARRPTPGGPARVGRVARRALAGRSWRGGRCGEGQRREPGLQLGAPGLLRTGGCQFWCLEVIFSRVT